MLSELVINLYKGTALVDDLVVLRGEGFFFALQAVGLHLVVQALFVAWLAHVLQGEDLFILVNGAAKHRSISSD